MISRKTIQQVASTALLTLSCSVYGAQPPGIHNFGNTCYLNSTLQNMYNATPITNALLAGPNIYPADTFAHAYVEFAREMRSVSLTKGVGFRVLGAANPQLIALRDQTFEFWHTCGVVNVAGQMDATEIIQTILNKLIDEAPQDAQKNARAQQFQIREAITVNCPITSFNVAGKQPVMKPFTRTRFENQVLLNLGIQGLGTLKECLASYFTPGLLAGDNTYRLDMSMGELTLRGDLVAYNRELIPHCSLTPSLAGLGDIVVIALKRFDTEFFGAEPRKLDHDIIVEPTVSFRPYMHTANLQKNAPLYELIGAVVQKGSLRGGHYIAYVKSNNEWFKCNDTQVVPTTWAYITNPTDANDEGWGIYKSYALFYRRIGAQQGPLTVTQVGEALTNTVVNATTQQQAAQTATLHAEAAALKLQQTELLKRQQELAAQITAEEGRVKLAAEQQRQAEIQKRQADALKAQQDADAKKQQLEELKRKQEQGTQPNQGGAQTGSGQPVQSAGTPPADANTQLAQALAKLQVALNALNATFKK